MASDQEDRGPGSEDAQILAFPADRPDPSLRELLGEVIRAERHEQGRTLVDVAREAAVSVPYLSEVERGRKEVSSDLLAAVHQALGLELVDVLDRAAQRLRVGPQRGRGGGPRMLAA